ncbi:hypothetical protein BDV98DRAFT_513952 [Pterulicium gracile]|uniref:Polysaccharide lyase 14 domain-containing protein n=1 Tax=Pterulicium gracile TaxID=1884261 RepID=A0A5C3Q5J7_9AGAR|nr:hypothetical protein BDV98DRAFT_513952 [Pterula gracilis]
MQLQRTFALLLLPLFVVCLVTKDKRADTHIERAVAPSVLGTQLIPVASFEYGFTTATSFLTSPLTNISLSDSALGVTRAQSNLPRPIVTPPSASSSSPPPPKSAYQATYPEGSINPGSDTPGGFGFYLSGEKSFTTRLAQSGTKEVLMSYRLMFQKGWEWQKGGKLPGVFGGEGDLAFGCSGGRQQGRCQCFNIRVMWRANGEGEIYTYLPLTDGNDAVLTSIPPRSIRNTDYGYSVGRGSFNLSSAVGKWVTIAVRVRLNSIGKKDGEMQLWVDGTSAINAKGLVIRGNNGATSRVKGSHFQTFFGGCSEDWASPQDQKAWFSDISGVIVE